MLKLLFLFRAKRAAMAKRLQMTATATIMMPCLKVYGMNKNSKTLVKIKNAVKKAS